jgi:predicted ester cyclase
MPTPHANTIEENKAVVRRFFDAVERGDFAVFDEIVADEYAHHIEGLPPGRAALKGFMTSLRSALPDIKMPILDLVGEDDKVAVRNRLQGTHMSDFGPMKATGKAVDIAVFHLFILIDCLLVEHWEVADMAALQAQQQY